MVTISEGSSYYFVTGAMNSFSFGIRKVERSFPAVEGQISSAAEPSDEISIDKNILEGMLRGVAIGIDSDEVKVLIEADGSGTDAYVEVSTRNSLSRRSFERTSAGRTGDKPTSFPISYKHILDTLGVFKGDSVVDMLVMSDSNLLMVKDITTSREVTTIIPFRTDKQIETEKREQAEAELARKRAADEAAMADSVEENAEMTADALASEEPDVDI